MPVWNRPPLVPNRLARLPLGSVRARGWLDEQLRLAADGLTGHMMEIWPEVGVESGWLGGPGESWERGPYYARGLTALAHTLADPTLTERARPWIEWSLASQRADGFFGPAGTDDWWSRMPMLDALRLHHDATGDPRVLDLMGRYFRHQLATLPARPLAGWARPRGGDNLASVLWLYNRTGEPGLLALADLLHRQTSDWLGELGRAGPPSAAFELAHGVNRAMGLKEPALYFQLSGDPRHLRALRDGWERTLAHHGQIQGTFSSDESLHGRDATQGTELCAIVELLATFESALAVSGEPWLADAIERIAYNALPAILSPDHRGHQYFQLANQVACTPGPHRFWVHHRTNLLFGPATGYGCCAANLHLAWPELASHLWLATRARGLAAMVLAPCEVRAAVGAGGEEVTIVEETGYPFTGEVRFRLRTRQPVAFPLAIRVPGWARDATLAVNETPERPVAAGMTTVQRPWRDGDTVVLRLPMPVRVARWERAAIAVERGPLVFALGIGEEWRKVGGVEPWADYELHPTTPWNYGLLVEPGVAGPAVRVEERRVGPMVWTREGAPVRLTVGGRRFPGWTLGDDGVAADVPETGAAPATARETLALVPFGCARLRIAVFPVA